MIQGLLEPVLGVGLVAERVHLAVTGRPVQADRLGQAAVGLQPQHGNPVRGGAALQLGQQPPAEPQSARGRGDPHPLDLGGRVTVELEPTTAHRLGVQDGDQEQPRRQGHFLVLGREAPARIEAAVEPAAQFVEVGLHAGAGGRIRGRAHGDLDRRRHQEPLHLGHRADQPGPLGPAEPGQDRAGRPVRTPVELGPLGPARGGEPGRAHPPVRPAAVHGDQPVRLQRAEQPAQVTRVQVQPGPQRPDIRAVRADLPQQPRLPERAVPGQELVIERTDPLGDGPVEPPDLADHGGIHSLTLVRECGRAPEPGAIQNRCHPESRAGPDAALSGRGG